jgi:hypothetical protein
LASVLVCTAGVALAQTGYMLRNADLKAKPFIDADTVAALPEKTPVEVVKQEGAWLLVKVRNQQGYVRLLQVRYNVSPSAAASASPLPPSTVARPTASSPTATTGVRGFDEVALQGAHPNPEELKKMQGFAATTDAARQFAQRAQLSARTLAYYGEDGKPLKGGK